jgi:hypothetical protein
VSETYTHCVVEALNVRQSPPPLVETFEKPWLIQWATQTCIIKTDTGYKVTDWAQLNYNGAAYGVPFMLISNNGTVKIPKTWLKPIANGVTYTPYK